jgi:hypothetical protein
LEYFNPINPINYQINFSRDRRPSLVMSARILFILATTVSCSDFLADQWSPESLVIPAESQVLVIDSEFLPLNMHIGSVTEFSEGRYNIDVGIEGEVFPVPQNNLIQLIQVSALNSSLFVEGTVISYNAITDKYSVLTSDTNKIVTLAIDQFNIPLNTIVRLVDLIEAPDLNGRIGKIAITLDKGMYTVQLSEDHFVTVKPKNIRFEY